MVNKLFFLLEDKTYIIPNINKRKIRLKINHCKSNLPYKIEIYYGNYNKSKINNPYYGEIVQGYFGQNEDFGAHKFSFKPPRSINYNCYCQSQS